MLQTYRPPPPARQPIFNLPSVVSGSIGVLLAIQVLREFILTPDVDFQLLLTFAFIPARITPPAVAAMLPGGEAAAVWSFVTYAFLHADWTHVGVNCLWLAAFGSPLAWRLGPTRFLLFSAAGAIGGAIAYLIAHAGQMAPMIGASAAISAHMAGVCRFLFVGPALSGSERGRAEAYQRPAASLLVVMRNQRVLVFVAVWFGINFIFGLFGAGTGLATGAIAWEAHIGGFLTGLFLFSLFDPVRPQNVVDRF